MDLYLLFPNAHGILYGRYEIVVKNAKKQAELECLNK